MSFVFSVLVEEIRKVVLPLSKFGGPNVSCNIVVKMFTINCEKNTHKIAHCKVGLYWTSM